MKFTSRQKDQRGFSLVELTIYLVIAAVLALLAVPRIRTFLIEGSIRSTGDDIVSSIARIRSNAEGTGTSPYANITSSTLANALRGRSVALSVDGTGNAATTVHKLGATGAQVTLQPAGLVVAGDSFFMTFASANAAACPGLTSLLQNNAETAAINGVIVKEIARNLAYNGQAAQDACLPDDTNSFVFVFR